MKDRVSKVRPWAAVAVVVAAGLLVYYGQVGLDYRDVSEQVSELTFRVRQLRAANRGQPPDDAAPKSELTALELRREELGAAFIQPGTDGLVALLASTARDTGVNLKSISIGRLAKQELESSQYWARPTALAITGETAAIYRFLSTVRERSPAVAVTSIRISGAGTSPSATLELQFYVAPWSTSEE